MTINWDKFLRRDRGSLLFSGISSLIVVVIMLFLYFYKEKINSKDDITFISGPFENYSWISLGGRSGSSLTFKLQNYSNRFKIKADFFPILQQAEFKAISYGEILKIGIPNGFRKYLNTKKEPFFVYSISSNENSYLDFKEAISKHNSPLFLYGAGIFAIAGYAFIYFGLKAKVKTQIW